MTEKENSEGKENLPIDWDFVIVIDSFHEDGTQANREVHEILNLLVEVIISHQKGLPHCHVPNIR